MVREDVGTMAKGMRSLEQHPLKQNDLSFAASPSCAMSFISELLRVCLMCMHACMCPSVDVNMHACM
jgi:hypothetical protein